jgi:hypothetical protein
MPRKCKGCGARAFKTLAAEVMWTCSLCKDPYCRECTMDTHPTHKACVEVKKVLDEAQAVGKARLASQPHAPSNSDCAF